MSFTVEEFPEELMPPPNHDEFDIHEEILHNDMIQDKGNVQHTIFSCILSELWLAEN